MIFRAEAEMITFGKKLGREIRKEFLDDHNSVVIELVGDVGTGKTTLSRGIAEGLGVKEPVTSPSFTISKHYAFPGGELIHYDFYRLPDPGLMADDLSDAIRGKNTVIIVEWGESVADILPENHIIYRIFLNDDGSRTLESVTDSGTGSGAGSRKTGGVQ